MFRGSDNGERSSVDTERRAISLSLMHNPAGEAQNAEESSVEEVTRDLDSLHSLSMVHRRQLSGGSENGGESIVDNEFFFIGIDFGTTYTGVAWSSPKSPDEVRVIQSWPGKTNTKVPSTIQYHKDGRKSWGFQASTDDPSTLQWFKLLLVDDNDMTRGIRSSSKIEEAKAALKKVGKQPQEVVKDYLSLIWAYTIESMHKHLTKDLVDSLPFRVVLTVPATWSTVPKASERLYEAAQQAGIKGRRSCGNTELDLVAEPEAAAFATLLDARREGELENDDIFVMCDAGGGTVDLVTYMMKDRYKMEVTECVEGDGGVCGSIFLDQSMEECLTKWLGKRWTGLTTLERHQFRDGRWTSIKNNFDGSDDQDDEVVPMGKASTASRLFLKRRKTGGLKVNKGSVHFDKKSITTIFSPVIEEIIKLVGSQITQTRTRKRTNPKVLILVGGLGGNRYLYSKLRSAYPDLAIIQRDGDRPITAICRGAVLKARSLSINPAVNTALDERIPPTPAVISRCPRLSYGVSFFETFDSEKHNELDKKFDIPSQKHVASELMHWYVQKGIDVLEADKPSYTFRRCLRSPPDGNRFTVTIWKCASDEPPESRRNRIDVSRCSEVVCSLDRSWNEFPLCENQAFREIVFELDLDVSRFPMLQFVAKMNGQVRGRRELKMEFA